MLVVARHENETITIGEAGMVLTGPSTVMFCGMRGSGARIGIEAQRDIPVHRSEIARRIENENKLHIAE